MKRYRIYFNHMAAAPLVWSIDEGDISTEIHVAAVLTEDAATRTRIDLEEQDRENRPRAWIEVCGTLSIDGRVATITGRR